MGLILKQKKKKSYLWKGSPFQYLVFGLVSKGGRNNLGRLCSFKQGGGVKRKYRIIDFMRSVFNIFGIVRRIEYDPNRNSYIALICYKNGILSYIISVEYLKINDTIINYFNVLNMLDLKNLNGSSLLLKNIAAGLMVCHVELKPGAGACFCRSAGTFALVLQKYKINQKAYVLLRLPSGVEYLLLDQCRAVLGIISNSSYRLFNWCSAGVARRKGIRPSVRGVAMNPVDHPHGGGEGRKSPARCAMSPWGFLDKGIKTKKKKNKFILKKRND